MPISTLTYALTLRFPRLGSHRSKPRQPANGHNGGRRPVVGRTGDPRNAPFKQRDDTASSTHASTHISQNEGVQGHGTRTVPEAERTARSEEGLDKEEAMRLQQRVKMMENELRKANEDKNSAEKSLLDLQERMRGASASLTQAQGEKRQLKETLLGLQGQLKQTSANLGRAGDDRRRLEGRVAELQKAWEDDLQRQEQANKEHARALVVLRTKHQDTLTLLETRTSELRAAQTYLTMVDSLSEADLLRMLGELNSLVYQLTAQMADCKMDFSRSQRLEDKWVAEMKANVEQHIGPHLLDLVVARAHSAEPICVQVALQSAVIRFATSVIATWNFQHDAANDMFRKVYDRLRDTEEPSVSTRWRVLTQSSLRSITRSEATEHHLRDSLAGLVTEIMLLAGSSISPPALYQTLRTQFGETLQSIITISLSLQKAIGEGVVSSHLEPSICAWGMPFNPDEMVNAFPSSHARTARPSDKPSPLLLGTTEVGLQRVERRESGDKIAGHPHIVMLLKPKVVLETFIDELRADGI